MVTVEVVPGTEAGPIFFEISHERSGRSWTVKQRFSALDAMRHALRKNRLPLPDVPFPRKQAPLLRLVNKWQPHPTPAMPAHELEDRRNGLQAYLTALSGLKDSWQSGLVTDVLCVAEEDATVPASSPAAADQPNNAVAPAVAPHCATKAVSWVDQQTPAAALTAVATEAARSRVPLAAAAASSSPPVSALSSKSIQSAKQAAVDDRDSSTAVAGDSASVPGSPAAGSDEAATNNEDDGDKRAFEAAAPAAEEPKQSVVQQQQQQPLSKETAPTGRGIVADELSERVPASTVFGDVAEVEREAADASGSALSKERAPAGPGIVADEVSERVPAAMVFGDVAEAEPGAPGVSGAAPLPTAVADGPADTESEAFSSLTKREADITAPVAPVADSAAGSPHPSSPETRAPPRQSAEPEKELPDVSPAVAEVEQGTSVGYPGVADSLAPDAVTEASVEGDGKPALDQAESAEPAPTPAAAVNVAEVTGELGNPPAFETSVSAPDEVVGQQQQQQQPSRAEADVPADVAAPAAVEPTLDSPGMTTAPEGAEEGVRGREGASAVSQLGLSSATEEGAEDDVGESQEARTEEPQQEETGRAVADVTSLQVTDETGKDVLPGLLLSAPAPAATAAVVLAAEVAAETETERNIWQAESPPMDDATGGREGQQTQAPTSPVAAPILKRPPLPAVERTQGELEQPAPAISTKPLTASQEKSAMPVAAAAAAAAATTAAATAAVTAEPTDKEEKQEEKDGDFFERTRGGASAVSTLTLSSASEDAKEEAAPQEAVAPSGGSTAAAAAAAAVAAAVVAEEGGGELFERGRGGASAVSALTLSSASEDAKEEAPPQEARVPFEEAGPQGSTVPIADSTAADVAAAVAKEEEKQEEGAGEHYERDRGGASAVSALGLSSASEDAKEDAALQQTSVLVGDSGAPAVSGQDVGEAGAGEHAAATPATAAKRRTSLLKRARRSLSSRKASPKRNQKEAAATIAEGRTSSPSERVATDTATLASPPATAAAPAALLSISPTPTSGSASSPAITTPRTVSKLASFRNRARSLTGRLSVGGGGGGGPLSARPSGSGPTSARKSLGSGGGGGGDGRSGGSGPLSLSSARGKGKGFFFSSAKSPPPSDAPGDGSIDPARTTPEGHIFSPGSIAGSFASPDGGDGLPGKPAASAAAAAAADAISLAIGSEGGTAATDVPGLAAPPSPGAE